MDELRLAFDTPPTYGRDVKWADYTVHDAASLLLKYINSLPEPLVPLDSYQTFVPSETLPENWPHAHGSNDFNKTCERYRKAILKLRIEVRTIFQYLFDVFGMFISKSNINKTTVSFLAALVQPGILSHPSRQSSTDITTAQKVLAFLIVNVDVLLAGL